jgi:hypothetical protein
MAHITVDQDALRIHLNFWEKIGSLSSNLSFPWSQVRGATADDSFVKDSLGMRTGGTGIPGFIALGHFRKKGDKIFAQWRHGEQVVIVELSNSRYDRLVLGSKDSRDLEARINAHLSRS